MEEIGVDFFPENYYDIKTDKKAEEEEEKEAKEQRERLIKNVTKVVNAIKILKNKNQKEEKKEEFIPGIITNRFKLFCEYRTNFQKQHFHHLEKDFFDDTKKLIKSSFLFNQNPNQNSLKYDQIELANISTNSNFAESYKKVNNILEDLLGNFSSLKSLQNERIKPKFSDEQNENKRIDNEIKALIKEMMKKIRFCEGLTKMEKNNNFIDESNIENKIINNVKMHLVSKIQNFSNEFRKNEQQFMKYLKEMGSDQEYLENDNKNENNNLNNSFDSSSSDDEKENLNKNFLQTQDDNFELRKRDEDINILANSINELSGIFKDLQNVVHEQGTILDRIDYNIEVSYENSHKGLKLLKKAEDHQNESCFRNVILALFLIIFIETLLIIIKIF